MSSGFVLGGTTDQPVERNDEWLRAQQEIETNRRKKEELSRQEGGKTLYEVLQGNKAAKQEAFEESIKLKNQFRNLDEDEIEFLDSVLESTRKKEEDVKRETTEQLDIFRRQQEEADKAILEDSGEADDSKVDGKAGSPEAGESQWGVNARKRKRAKGKEGLKGVKIRKSSSTLESPIALLEKQKDVAALTVSKEDTDESAKATDQIHPPSTTSIRPPVTTKPEDPKSTTATGLGLVGYSSDEED